MAEHGITTEFIQDNHSLSSEVGTVRGLHFQSPPHAQPKLVRCGKGGDQVVNLDALTYAACLDNVADVADSPNYSFEQADIRDRAALDRVLAKHQPDAVMHLAAESHVDRSIDGPSDFIETNITGTFNMLEAARSYWVARGKPDDFRFHHISTDSDGKNHSTTKGKVQTKDTRNAAFE